MRFFAPVATLAALMGLSSIAACTQPRTGITRDGGTTTGGRDTGPVPTACSAGVTSFCRGQSSVACTPDGMEGAVTDCSATGGGCLPNFGCTSPCADAERDNSYIGCEYWPVATLNNGLRVLDPTTGDPVGREAFHFAVAVANPGSAAATVTVDRAGTQVATRTVAPGALEVIQLDWDENLQPIGDSMTGLVPSVLERNAAYHLVSTLPVTVYQFNPLEYEAPGSLPDTVGTTVNSFSNDASLLLPSHTLTGNYIVMSRPTHQLRQVYHPALFPRMVAGDFTASSPGFMTLVGVNDGTSVDITFSAFVTASTDGAVRAFSPGQTGTFTLNRGDVLQITSGAPASCSPGPMVDQGGATINGTDYIVDVNYCVVDDRYDLTGTVVRSAGQVELVAGHNCAFVPSDRWACDHLEEGIFPLETWGTSALVTITRPLRSEPNVIRILSGDDNNTITFDPPSAHATITLNRGEYAEFEATQSFRAQGTQSISVGQYLVGQDYAGYGTAGAGESGDPSQSLAIPTEQYRTSYTFLAPDTYAQNFVAVSAPTGTAVMLDGSPISGFTPIGGTGFDGTSVSVSGGVHSITSSSPFGIVVYGFGSFTSYMYPGGLDLQQINVPF